MKTEIKICMGSACFARGNDVNLEYIEKYIKDNALEAKLELVGSRCENCCENGPNIIINKKRYSQVTPEKLQKILEEIK